MSTPTTRTKIQPAQVFQLVKLMPKSMQDDFRKRAYEDITPEGMDFTPEPERRYNHSLGLDWLTSNNVPNTVEGLEEQRQYLFQTVVDGPHAYNVGQFFVVFPRAVYSTKDLESNVLVIEVMDELLFPAMPDLKVAYNDEIRNATWEAEAATAMRYALQAYVTQGKIRIHDAGYRVYSGSDEYRFQERWAPEPVEALSFGESVRRNQRS